MSFCNLFFPAVCAHHKQKLLDAVTLYSQHTQERKALVSAFRSFARAAKETRLTGHTPLGELKKRTVQKKACAARRLIDVFFEIIAKSDKDEFKRMTLSSTVDIWNHKKTSNKVGRGDKKRKR